MTPVLFVAEIGLNHDGNFDLAYELIRQAKAAGADIAKFQFGWRDRPDEINHIDLDRARQLVQWCEYWDVEFMASIITEEALELARAVQPHRYKIASRTVAEKPALVRRVLEEGKETFVSLGMWEEREWPFGPPDDRLRYIYCRSRYPTYPADLVGMPTQFDEHGFYGYSDHLHGIEGCLLAVARGARYVEKHITLNRGSRVIRDHVVSATPQEFVQLTQVGCALGRLRDAINAVDRT